MREQALKLVVNGTLEMGQCPLHQPTSGVVSRGMKLFLYSSYLMAPEHSLALSQLVGKAPASIRVAAIANATDVIPDAHAWVDESRESLKRHGAHVEPVDLRECRENPVGLRAHLARYDVLWLCGGHQFYLRWILRASGADDIITELVTHGMVYAAGGAPEPWWLDQPYGTSSCSTTPTRRRRLSGMVSG